MVPMTDIDKIDLDSDKWDMYPNMAPMTDMDKQTKLGNKQIKLGNGFSLDNEDQDLDIASTTPNPPPPSYRPSIVHSPLIIPQVKRRLDLINDSGTELGESPTKINCMSPYRNFRIGSKTPQMKRKRDKLGEAPSKLSSQISPPPLLNTPSKLRAIIGSPPSDPPPYPLLSPQSPPSALQPLSSLTPPLLPSPSSSLSPSHTQTHK